MTSLQSETLVPQTLTDQQLDSQTPPSFGSPADEFGDRDLSGSLSDSCDNLTDDAKLEFDNDLDITTDEPTAKKYQDLSDGEAGTAKDEAAKSRCSSSSASKDDHGIHLSEPLATLEDNEATVADHSMDDLDFDYVLDDAVMSFVNLAIANAMKSTGLDVTSVSDTVPARIGEVPHDSDHLHATDECSGSLSTQKSKSDTVALVTGAVTDGEGTLANEVEEKETPSETTQCLEDHSITNNKTQIEANALNNVVEVVKHTLSKENLRLEAHGETSELEDVHSETPYIIESKRETSTNSATTIISSQNIPSETSKETLEDMCTEFPTEKDKGFAERQNNDDETTGLATEEDKSCAMEDPKLQKCEVQETVKVTTDVGMENTKGNEANLEANNVEEMPRFIVSTEETPGDVESLGLNTVTLLANEVEKMEETQQCVLLEGKESSDVQKAQEPDRVKYLTINDAKGTTKDTTVDDVKVKSDKEVALVEKIEERLLQVQEEDSSPSEYDNTVEKGTTEDIRTEEVVPDIVETQDNLVKVLRKGAGEPDNSLQNRVRSHDGEEDDNVKSTQGKLIDTKEGVTNNLSEDTVVGMPIKKVAGVINARVSNILQDADTEHAIPPEPLNILKPDAKQGDVGESGLALVNDRLRIRIAELQSQIKEGVMNARVSNFIQDAADAEAADTTPAESTKQGDVGGDGESGLAMVNDRLRIRIAELQSQIKGLCCELAFVGDRNWRLEAYTECLIHTLEKMDVTDIEDLDRKMSPLSLFKVKVKAGYRLGPYNGLPQRARRSYQRDGLTPPTIDLSGGSLRCQTPINGKGELDFNISSTDDIGLSAKQMQQYEAQVETLTMKTHFLETQLQHLKATGLAPPAIPCDTFGNPDFSVVPPPDCPAYSYCPSVPPGVESYGVPMGPNGAPVQAVPPYFNMAPQRRVYNVENSEEPADIPQLPQSIAPSLSPLPPKEDGAYNKVTYVPPPRFRSRHAAGPHASSSAPDAGRQSFGSYGRSYRNDVGRGRSATELRTTSGPGSWRRTERASPQSLWRTPSNGN